MTKSPLPSSLATKRRSESRHRYHFPSSRVKSCVVPCHSIEVRIPCHSVTFRLPRSRHVATLSSPPAVKFDTFYMTVIRPPITSPLRLAPLSHVSPRPPSSQDALRCITRPRTQSRSLARPVKQSHPPPARPSASVRRRQVQVARPPVFYSPNRRRKNEDPISLRSKLTNGREREGAEDPSR